MLLGCGTLTMQKMRGVRVMAGFVAALIWAIVAIPVRGIIFMALFGRLFQTPLISGVMVILLMVQIAPVSAPA